MRRAGGGKQHRQAKKEGLVGASNMDEERRDGGNRSTPGSQLKKPHSCRVLKHKEKIVPKKMSSGRTQVMHPCSRRGTNTEEEVYGS